jgi:CheY-like chemotaxis protein
MDRTILLVEDDANDVFFFKRAARAAGLLNPLQVAADGRHAIHYLQGAAGFGDRSQFPFPGLILLDLQLPHVPGLDVLRWIRAQPESQPIVIVLTSSRQAADINAAYRLGANSYIVKPSSPGKLQDIVVGIKHYWLGLNEPPQDGIELARVTPNLTADLPRLACSDSRA